MARAAPERGFSPRAIHNASPRNSKPFIAINCGALPEQLLESDCLVMRVTRLPGAVSNREGLFQAAKGGHAISR
ncbi:sigma 54-interacting transcriptional regulator [Shigella flexneri]